MQPSPQPKTLSQSQYSQSSHSFQPKHYYSITFFSNFTTLKTINQSEKYKEIHDTLLSIRQRNWYKNRDYVNNPNRFYSNMLGLEILEKIAELKYLDMERFVKYFASAYWLDKEGIIQYVKFGIQLVQREVVKGFKNANKLPLEDLYLVISVLNSINELLLVSPGYILKELDQIQVEDNVSNSNKNQKKKGSKNQEKNMNPVQTSLLQLYTQLLKKLPSQLVESKQRPLIEKIYSKIVDIRKLKLKICQNKLQILREDDPQKNTNFNPKQSKKNIRKFFDQIWKQIQNKDIKEWTAIYDTQFEQDIRYILENIYTKQDYPLLDIQTLTNIGNWLQSSKGYSQAGYRIERLWSRIREICRQGKQYAEKNNIISKYMNAQAIQYIYEKDRFDYILINYTKAVREIKSYIGQNYEKYLMEPDKMNQFASNLIYKIKTNYEKLIVDNYFFPSFEKNKHKILEMYEKNGVLVMQNYANHKLAPYEILVTKMNSKELALDCVSDLHFRPFLRIVEQIAKKQFADDDERQQSERQISALWKNTAETPEDANILFQKIVMLQLVFKKSIEIQKLEQVKTKPTFGGKIKAFIALFTKIREQYYLFSQITKLQQLFKQKKYIQGILFIKQIEKYWEVFKNKNMNLPPKTLQVWKIHEVFYSKNRSIVKFSINEVNDFKNQLKDFLTMEDADLIEIILFLYNTVEQKTGILKPDFENLMKNSGPLVGQYGKLMKIYKNNRDVWSFFINTSKLKGSMVKLIEQLQRIKENVPMMKIFKFKSTLNQREQFMHIVVQAKKFKFENANDTMKFILETLSQLKQLNEDQEFNNIKFWYFLLTKNHLKIHLDQKQQIQCSFPVFEAILARLILTKEQLQAKFNNLPLDHPFIHFTKIIRQHLSVLSNNDNKCLKEELIYSLNQIKAIEMQNPPHKNNIAEFLQLPLFWSVDKRMTSIVNFSETFHSQLRLEQARRKKNKQNLDILQQALSNQKDKKKQQVLKKIKQQFHSRTHERKDEATEDQSKNAQQQRKRQIQNRIEILGKKLGQIQYQVSNKMNSTSAYFYIIEGIFQKDAYEMNLCNTENKEKYQDHPELLRYGRDYDWFIGKDEIKKFILDESRRQSIKKNKSNKTSENQNDSSDEYYLPTEQELENKVFEKTYKSLQTHLYFMRCFLSHSQKKLGPNNEQIQLTLQQKIDILNRNYPKIFIFLHKWRNVIGRPMYEKTLIQHKKNNKDYTKLMDQIYKLRNRENNIEESNKLRLKLPDYLQQPGTVKDDIVKTLKALFPERRENNKDIIDCLRQKLSKYDKVRLFTNYDSFQKSLSHRNILDLPEQKSPYCHACGIFAIGVRRGYRSQTKGNKKIGYVSLWAFLDEVKQANFNYLFHEHQGNQHCIWSQQENVCYYYHNMKLRKKLVRDEKAILQENKEDNTAVLEKIEQNQQQARKKKQKNNTNQNNQKGKKDDKTSWQKYLQACEENKNYEQELKQELKQTDYLPKGFLYHLLINYPNFIQDVRENRDVWDRKLYKVSEDEFDFGATLW